MTIVSQRIIDEYENGQGQKALRLGYTDHTGKEGVYPRVIPWETDANNFLVDHAKDIEALLSRQELRGVAKRVDNGEDPLSVVGGAIHATGNDIVKKLVEFMLENKDIRFVTKMTPLIDSMRIAHTTAELAGIIDDTELAITTFFTQYDTIKTISNLMSDNNFTEGWG